MDEFTTPLPAFYEPASSPSPLCVLTIHTDFGSLDIPTATVAATLPVHPRKSKPAAQQGPDRGYPSKLRARASQKPYLKSTAPPRAMSAPLSNARAQSAPPGDTETSPSGFKLLSPFPEVIGAGARVRFRIPITREPTPTTLDRPRVSEVIDGAHIATFQRIPLMATQMPCSSARMLATAGMRCRVNTRAHHRISSPSRREMQVAQALVDML